jgi:hypothetical protein
VCDEQLQTKRYLLQKKEERQKVEKEEATTTG